MIRPEEGPDFPRPRQGRKILRPGGVMAWTPFLLLAAGCSMVPTIRENTSAIVRSTEGISTNTERVGESSSTLASLEPSMTRLAELQRPMEELYEPLTRVAALSPELRSVSGLAEPMAEMSARVQALDERMAALDDLRRAMERLMALEESMDGLAGLEGPMMQLAALRGPMEETSRLGEPMRELKESMDDLMALTQGPWVLLGLGAALLWSLLTFLAVWIGVAFGMRRGPRGISPNATT